MRRTVVYAAVCVSFCTHLILTVPIFAASSKAESKPAPRQGWKPARMGVTAVVLPRCAVQVDKQATPEHLPVTVRCTRNTHYSVSSPSVSLDILAADAAEAAVRPAQEEFGKTGRYVITRTLARKEMDADHEGAPLLSIDF